MTDFRRTLLWMVFTVSLLMLWDAWNKHNGHPTMFGMPVATTDAVPAAAPGASAPGATASASLPTPSAAGAPAAAAPAAAAPVAASQLVTVRTDVVEAQFDSRGASLVRLALLKQVNQQDRTQPVVLFDRSAQRTYLAQSGLIGAPGWPTHLTPMNVEPGERELAAGRDAVVLRFVSPPSGGLQRTVSYTLKRGSYVIDVKQEVSNVGAAPQSPQLYLQLVRDGRPLPEESSFYHTFTGPAVYTADNKFQKIAFKDLDKGAAEHDKQADNGWVAMVQHYFASAWLHTAAAPREFFSRKVDGGDYAVGMIFPLGQIAPGQSKVFDAQLFAGPQEEKKLAELAPGLETVKDYGIVTILAKPLFWLLDKIHGLVGNWGWAIVLLVVLLKIAFYGLNASAYRSMAKMKALNPRIQEMRERLKNDPQKMQMEMMRIYREEKVNPIGGCLPILIQIPVFIALYWVLLSSVEMRNAPWIGWITDLSVKDPYFVLPVLMTASSLLQTWLNPTPPDPMQAKLMWIMPLAFSVMFFFFPAGLVLYWLTNNLLSIAQQWMINKRLGVTQ
ncbi:MAG: membrane protein insertase YidC [Pseudomonadota bacterium]